MYSLKNVLLQKPDQVKRTVLSILGLLVLAGAITISADTAVAWAIAIENVLGMLYVSPLTVSKAGIQALVDDPNVKPLGD